MRNGTILRWMVRLAALLLAGGWLFIAVMEGRDAEGGLEIVDVIMGVLILLGVLAVILAWVNERAGARMLAVVALLHGIFAALEAGHHHLLAVLIAAGPYALIAAGFFYVHVRWPRRRVHPSDAVTLRQR